MNTNKSQLERSPHYETIKKSWEETLPAVQSGEMTRGKFFTDAVLPKIPGLARSIFYRWADKNGAKDIQNIRGAKKQLEKVDAEFQQLADQAEELTPGEVLQVSDKMTRVLLVWAKLLLRKKVSEFVKNPGMAEKMSFNQVIELYKTITDEEKKERELRLKERASQRADAYTIFRIGVATGLITDEHLNTLRQRVADRRKRYEKRHGKQIIESESEDENTNSQRGFSAGSAGQVSPSGDTAGMAN